MRGLTTFLAAATLTMGCLLAQAGERYADQPVGAFCSGVLVGDDLVLTAVATTTTTLSTSQPSVTYGTQVTFTATVVANAGSDY